MPRGLFVTFEGLDGSGKSTQLRRLKEWLQAEGRPVTTTRQPGGTRVGDRIRALLLDTRTESLAPLSELGLMFSDRAQSIAEVIEPALQAGHIVLCDRFTDSSEAYQGGGRQLGSQVVLDLHAALTAIESCRIIVIGAGFIGAEVASTCAGLGCRVTVIEAMDIPLSNVLGPMIGTHCASLHAAHGVDLRTGVGVADGCHE